MGFFKCNVFFLLSAFYVISVSGQQQINTKKITLLENYFRCSGCELTSPKIPKQQLINAISKDSLLQEAAQKIKKYFTSEGDHFILFCKNCTTQPRTSGYLVRANAIKSSDKGFGTYIDSRMGGNHKGGEEFYKLKDLLNYLTDSVFVFDTLELSAATIVDNNTSVLGSLRASFQYKNILIERPITYDTETQVCRLDYKSLFGSTLPRSVSDTLPVTLHYYSADNEKVVVPGTLKVFFASTAEKEDLANLFKLYKEAFPEWTIEEIAGELVVKITAKYHNTSMTNFIEWLKKLK